MKNAFRIAWMGVRLAFRIRAALFFTIVFPIIFLFVFDGLFAKGNPRMAAYLFGPIITFNVMGSGFWGLGLRSVMERERGSLRRYRLAPIGPGTIILSMVISNYILQLPTIGLLVFCAVVLFHMPLSMGWVTLLLLVTVGMFAFAGFGLSIASIANTMQEAQIYNNLAWMTLIFLSGVTIPLVELPHWLQHVAAFLPATYMVVLFQNVMSPLAQSLMTQWPAILVLIASGVFGLLLALKLFRWEKEERISGRRKLWALVFAIPFLGMGFWLNFFGNPIAAWAKTYTAFTKPPVSQNARTLPHSPCGNSASPGSTSTAPSH